MTSKKQGPLYYRPCPTEGCGRRMKANTAHDACTACRREAALLGRKTKAGGLASEERILELQALATAGESLFAGRRGKDRQGREDVTSLERKR